MSRGERQKPISDRFRLNYEDIFKKPKGKMKWKGRHDDPDYQEAKGIAEKPYEQKFGFAPVKIAGESYKPFGDELKKVADEVVGKPLEEVDAEYPEGFIDALTYQTALNEYNIGVDKDGKLAYKDDDDE